MANYKTTGALISSQLDPTEKTIESCHFLSNAVIVVMETWLDGQISDFFLSGLQKFGHCNLFPSWSG